MCLAIVERGEATIQKRNFATVWSGRIIRKEAGESLEGLPGL